MIKSWYSLNYLAFIWPFHKYLLSIFFMADTEIVAGDKDTAPCLPGTYTFAKDI